MQHIITLNDGFAVVNPTPTKKLIIHPTPTKKTNNPSNCTPVILGHTA